jgi:hypothetical protein
MLGKTITQAAITAALPTAAPNRNMADVGLRAPASPTGSGISPSASFVSKTARPTTSSSPKRRCCCITARSPLSGQLELASGKLIGASTCASREIVIGCFRSSVDGGS